MLLFLIFCIGIVLIILASLTFQNVKETKNNPPGNLPFVYCPQTGELVTLLVKPVAGQPGVLKLQADGTGNTTTAPGPNVTIISIKTPCDNTNLSNSAFSFVVDVVAKESNNVRTWQIKTAGAINGGVVTLSSDLDVLIAGDLSVSVDVPVISAGALLDVTVRQGINAAWTASATLIFTIVE